MKKAVMYGAGNIGRGFIGQIFSESEYEVTFIDINEDVVTKLNHDNCYPQYITKGQNYEKNIIKNVKAINGADTDSVAIAISDADIMATAVGVNVLPHIAKPIAEGIKKIYKINRDKFLNIIICENLIGSDKFLKKLVCDHLSDDEISFLDKHIGFVEASIGRMVPITPDFLKEKNLLSVCVEEYCELPVDKAAFKGEIPYIKNMLPFEPFDYYIQRKLFIHNMGHAITAYLGQIYGYGYIHLAATDPSVKFLTLQAMTESALALSKEHCVEIEELISHAQELLYRFENKLLGDTTYRVGRDTVRKLSENDRLAGAMKLCIKHNISPIYICLGIAAALCFDDPSDKTVSSSVENNGIQKTVNIFCKVSDEKYITLIDNLYTMLKAKTDLKHIISYLETEKAKENRYEAFC